jgi:hypothetical protein
VLACCLRKPSLADNAVRVLSESALPAGKARKLTAADSSAVAQALSAGLSHPSLLC